MAIRPNKLNITVSLCLAMLTGLSSAVTTAELSTMAQLVPVDDGAAQSQHMGISEDGTSVTVQDTAGLWGDPAWSASYLWSDAVDNDDPLYSTSASSVSLNND